LAPLKERSIAATAVAVGSVRRGWYGEDT